jgi:hypothetical protein
MDRHDVFLGGSRMVVQGLSDIWVGRWALEGSGISVGLKVCILEVRKGHFSYSWFRMVF